MLNYSPKDYAMMDALGKRSDGEQQSTILQARARKLSVDENEGGKITTSQYNLRDRGASQTSIL